MKPTHHASMFDPEKTFKSFGYGPNGRANDFASAAALAAANNPGKAHNPLFIHGGVGLGKTHLLHAIGQHVNQSHPNAQVAYLSAEQFTGEFVAAIQNRQLARFRQKYLQTDVLLIDEIEFLVGKERLQEELFHTFRLLHEQHKQIVLAGNVPLGEIQTLEQRLVARFEWGLVTGLQRSEIETHLPMRKRKTQLLGV